MGKLTQSLENDDVPFLGFSVALDEDRLAVSNFFDNFVVFVYSRDRATNVWIPEGNVSQSYGSNEEVHFGGSYVDIHNDILAVASISPDRKKVASFLYKREQKDVGVSWREHAVLKTDREPMHYGVSCEVRI